MEQTKPTFSELIKGEKPVLIDFYTDWCPPCKKLSKVTFKEEKMAAYFHKENYILLKVNQVMSLLEQPPGTKLLLKLRRGPQTLEKKLTLESLI